MPHDKGMDDLIVKPDRLDVGKPAIQNYDWIKGQG